ncbi:MAG: UvrD-helicase domain-containing protein [Propionibacteriaceae bacterium]|nr:UvrD-helicase domain-containing protein [Propionibacteriaceae bacterium]
MDVAQILDGLDPDQRRVAETLGEPLGVIAGAGTGKTRTITHRLAYAVLAGAIDPRATLACTFTTAAAAEVRTRLEAMGVRGVQSRTFHSAALRQAQYFWPQAYGSALPRVEDRREPLVAQACTRVGLAATPAEVAEVAAEISWTKQTNVLPEDYIGLARTDRRTLLHVTSDSVADAIVAYEEAKQAACVIDLDDLLLCTVALLATQPDVAKQVRATYRHFVFDEFQDVSPVEWRLVELWTGGRRDVCVVGDPAQTIHTFAGARSQYLESFAAGRPGAGELVLTTNYRSTTPVLEAAAAVGRSPRRLQSARGAGPAVELVPARDALDEAVATARWLKDRHADGVAWGDLAVLFRTHAGVESIRQILADEGVPFGRLGVGLGTLHGAKGREWEGVTLGGLHDGTVPSPLARSAAQLAEERRLLYVGLTRARTFLRLTWPVTAGGRPARPSRFLAGLGAT